MRRAWPLLVALTLAWGCAGGDDGGDGVDGAGAGDGDASDETLSYDDGLVAFEVPAWFERTPEGDELTSGLEVEFLDDPSGEEPLPEQVTFGYGVPDDPTFSILAWPTFAFGAVTGDDEQLSREEVDVAGAEEALQVSYRVHRPDIDEPMRIVALGAIVEGPDGPLIADLRYYATESDFDEDVAARVFASLRVSR